MFSNVLLATLPTEQRNNVTLVNKTVRSVRVITPAISAKILMCSLSPKYAQQTALISNIKLMDYAMSARPDVRLVTMEATVTLAS